MPIIQPFRALRPAPQRAAEVLAPPYDVLSSSEARQRAAGKPNSFLHVSKPEIDLPQDTDPYSAAVYAKAAENLARMCADGVLIRDQCPCYYAYRLTREGRTQTGIAAAASVADYATNRIRKHEFTTPVKEDDRVRQIEAVNAETGPVMIAYPKAPDIDALIGTATTRPADVDVTADDGVRHQMWTITDAGAIAAITAAFEALPAVYIADGHHRSAAAQRVSASREATSPAPEASHRSFLAVLFPHHEMTILDYNRVIRDLNGLTPAALLQRIATGFRVQPVDDAARCRPTAPGEFAMYLDGRWYELAIDKSLIPSDPVAKLDVSLLADNLIAPILGITDQRRDKRIDFVGGARGLDELQRRVDSGEMAVAFALHPTSMEDLMAVAEAGKVMPPKSTWFEPKLADGMVSHVLD